MAISFWLGFAGLDLKGTGIPTIKEYVEKYCRDMNIKDTPKLNVYFAFSFFRIAAILQGVYKRSMQGRLKFFCHTVFILIAFVVISPILSEFNSQ